MSTVKKCKRCEVEKSVDDFHNHIKNKDGKAIYCKPCNKSMMKPRTKDQALRDTKKYNLAHPEKRKAIWNSYYERNKDKLRDKKKEWKEKPGKKELLAAANLRNKDKINEQRRARRANPKPHQRVEKALRDRFMKVIVIMKSGKRYGSWRELIGCTIKEIKIHIESQFIEGMTWGNHGNGEGKWNIDHIKPLYSFNLMDLEEQRKAFHYTNTRPLWFVDNMRRSKTEYPKAIAQKFETCLK